VVGGTPAGPFAFRVGDLDALADALRGAVNARVDQALNLRQDLGLDGAMGEREVEKGSGQRRARSERPDIARTWSRPRPLRRSARRGRVLADRDRATLSTGRQPRSGTTGNGSFRASTDDCQSARAPVRSQPARPICRRGVSSRASDAGHRC
jgi:hypothetical protein